MTENSGTLSSLKSIKRDFERIPIMVAWQAISPERLTQWQSDFNFEKDFYNKMFETARSNLQGYLNEKWYFINIHRLLEGDPKPYIDAHLDDEGALVVAEMLAKAMQTRGPLDRGCTDLDP